MRIQNNITAENSHRQLGLNTRNISTNTEKLSSGLRVNRAADDAAGLAISEKMRTQIRGLNRASLNIQDGVSLLQVGDGALQYVHNKLQRMRELSVQAANDTNQLLDREAIQLEFGELSAEINQVVQMTNFNGRLLFDGSIGASWEYNLGRMTAPYTTTIPAGDDFVAPLDVPGWNAPAATFGVISTIRTDLHAATFPTDGVFAMQIVTPADGTLNVILDFADPSFDGTMDGPNGFLNFFKNAFNNLGLGEVVEDIHYLSGPGQIVFDFPRDGNTLTGIMGKPGTTLPRVTVGIGQTVGAVPPGTPGGALQQDSLNGELTSWTSEPFRTNRPGIPFPGSDTIRNNAIYTTNNTRPIPAASGATAPAGGFPSITITVNGTPTTIHPAPGNYPDAQSFVDTNSKAFESAMPRGFTIALDDDGKLTIATSGTDSSPAVDITFDPVELAAALGFGGIGAGDIVTEREPGGFLPIQSGANEGDLVEIEIPRLCTRSLGITIRRPEDERDIADGGFEHINGLGADGYTTTANVAGDPMEYSLDVTSHEKAAAALSVLTNAINIISMERARMGAQQNRLESAMRNVDNSGENLQAAESRIRDIDMAEEMTSFVQNQILIQASTAMLAQANTLPQGVLQLLG